MPSIINATTSTGLVSTADNSGSLQLATNNGTTAVTVDTSQRVGIGTSTPNDTLEVAGANAFIRVNRTGNEPGISFRYSNSSTNRGDIAVTSAGAMYFTAGGSTERMRINSDGGLRTQVTGGGSIMETFGTRAWVRKNSGHDSLGNGIMGSGNVSSLTQQSTGRWTVNLSNAMPDTNYAVIATSFRSNSDSLINEDYSIRSTTTFTLNIHNISIPPTQFDFGFSAIVVR